MPTRMNVACCCISLGPEPVGVQCPITSSLSEFPGYWDWLRYPGLSPVLVSIAFSFALHISVFFSFALLHLPLDFIRVSSLKPTYLHPFDRPFSLLMVNFQAWDWFW